MQAERLTAERLMTMLGKQGRQVTLDQATAVLEILRKMARQVVEDHIKENGKLNLLHQSSKIKL